MSDIEQSIASLKQVEEDRRVTYLQNNLNESLGVETECDILNTANQLCSDLELEDRVTPMGDSSDPVLSMPIKSLLKRTKKMQPTWVCRLGGVLGLRNLNQL
jgi:hypothetical protein